MAGQVPCFASFSEVPDVTENDFPISVENTTIEVIVLSLYKFPFVRT